MVDVGLAPQGTAVRPQGFNMPLVDALNRCSQVKVIVTLGFLPIVKPLVAAMGVRDAHLVAMSHWRFRDRREGKHSLVAKVLGQGSVSRALFVTDSLDDQDLLEKCKRPMRVVWPEANFVPAFQDIYIPGLYISRVKRPGMRYIYRSIISDEMSVWVLASITLVTHPALHLLGLAMLSVSFWAIYEAGYVDNDLIGVQHEEDPVLTRQFYESPVRLSAVLPWAWATACGVIALLLLRWPEVPSAIDFFAWTGVLLLTFFWFRLYNRVDKRTRIWLFGGLQSLRSLSFIAVVNITLIGAVALISHVLARWVPYYSYRLSGGKCEDGDVGSSRLLFFSLISIGLAIVVGWEFLWSPPQSLSCFGSPSKPAANWCGASETRTSSQVDVLRRQPP